jgi:hypothetical protein
VMVFAVAVLERDANSATAHVPGRGVATTGVVRPSEPTRSQTRPPSAAIGDDTSTPR